MPSSGRPDDRIDGLAAVGSPERLRTIGTLESAMSGLRGIAIAVLFLVTMGALPLESASAQIIPPRPGPPLDRVRPHPQPLPKKLRERRNGGTNPAGGAGVPGGAVGGAAKPSAPTPAESRRLNESLRAVSLREAARRDETFVAKVTLYREAGRRDVVPVEGRIKRLDEGGMGCVLEYARLGDLPPAALLLVTAAKPPHRHFRYLPETRRLIEGAGAAVVLHEGAAVRVEDFMSPIVKAASARFIEDAIVGGKPAILFEDADPTRGVRRRVWMRADTREIARIEEFEGEGETPSRRLSYDESRLHGVFRRPGRLLIEELTTGRTALIEFEKRAINVGLDLEAFRPEALAAALTD